MADASQCYKQTNSQSSARLDVSSSLSALEESSSSLAEGEGGNANCSSATEDSSQHKFFKTMAIVHDSNPSQVSSPTNQERTVIQMDPDEADKRQELGASLSPGEGTRCGINACSENPELQAKEPVRSRGEVGGSQSQTGGVHSVSKATLLAPRASSFTAS